MPHETFNIYERQNKRPSNYLFEQAIINMEQRVIIYGFPHIDKASPSLMNTNKRTIQNIKWQRITH